MKYGILKVSKEIKLNTRKDLIPYVKGYSLESVVKRFVEKAFKEIKNLDQYHFAIFDENGYRHGYAQWKEDVTDKRDPKGIIMVVLNLKRIYWAYNSKSQLIEQGPFEEMQHNFWMDIKL